MPTINVELDQHSYPLYIGAGCLSETFILQHIPHDEVLIVSNAIVAEHYLKTLENSLKGKRCKSVLLPDGESFKTLDTLNLIFDALVMHKFSRQCTLIALGGGVVGDITGFAAACYQRGVGYIQVPTSLLAQVDSSIGGKTAVNHKLGKNMIGAFYQPKAVIIDVNTLSTLAQREFASGLAEVIKYGLIYDAHFFEWLEQNAQEIYARDINILSEMITRCCQIKADIVAQDEKDLGLRMILNFGHTFAHAIEAIAGYGELLHGEAVAIGMVLALRLSEKLALIHYHLVERLQNWLKCMQLPTELPKALSSKALLEAMELDKKNTDSSNRFILLEGLGRAVIKQDVALGLVQSVLKEV
ncbi:MAG: 3-dehydroquinate synthase [Gammaproteobacteria bacterium]|jgi:3-dehydroquinate synthase|nr:3-dehydroquinate synthase [Gammaproteobacteria bacterium]